MIRVEWQIAELDRMLEEYLTEIRRMPKGYFDGILATARSAAYRMYKP